MVEIHEIWTATTIIIGTFNDRDINTATGFFFIDEEKTIYLIKNKHVIYGDNYSDNPAPRINKIRLNLHTNVNDLKQNEWVNIDLFKNGQRIWLEHQNPVIDVILIPIALDRGKYVFLALDKTYLDSENALIYFEKIFVLGYPRGWYDYVNNLPITRIGNLSSPFKVPFLGINPYMIADVQTHPGMSGGPVLMDLQDFTVIKDGKLITYPGRRKFLLTGIYSGQCKIPGMDERPNLITIWFPELITDIIKANSSKK